MLSEIITYLITYLCLGVAWTQMNAKLTRIARGYMLLYSVAMWTSIHVPYLCYGPKLFSAENNG